MYKQKELKNEKQEAREAPGKQRSPEAQTRKTTDKQRKQRSWKNIGKTTKKQRKEEKQTMQAKESIEANKAGKAGKKKNNPLHFLCGGRFLLASCHSKRSLFCTPCSLHIVRQVWHCNWTVLQQSTKQKLLYPPKMACSLNW